MILGKEIDLLKNYPKSKRDISKRLEYKSEEDRLIARKFDKEFFDGERKHGYGGFSYNEKYWRNVINDFIQYWKLNNESSVLDIGCAKGFMLYDLSLALPKIKYAGIDISKYAIENSIDAVKDNLSVGNATKLPYEDKSFDVVISINTLHNLEESDFKIAVNEINRVSKKFSFITVDAYRNEEEKEKINAWNLTAKTIKSTEKWKEFFKEINYKGDFYWFIP